MTFTGQNEGNIGNMMECVKQYPDQFRELLIILVIAYI